MKSKGFTIVELLAAIVILGILSAIIVPNISSYVSMSKDEYNNNVKKQMLLAGKNFYSENTERLPKDTGVKTADYISVQELSTLKYVDNEFVDADENSCMDKSYVVVANMGIGPEYYACMICGPDENKYITNEEQFYCDLINYVDDGSNNESSGSGTGDEAKGKAPVCKVEKETGYTDDGLDISLTASDEDGYIAGIYIINRKTNNIENLLQENEQNKSIINKKISLNEYGNNRIFIIDNNFNRTECTNINYEASENTKLNVNMYYITKDQYNNYKNKGFTDDELNNLEIYNGNDWKSGYIYVDLDYYNFQYDSITVKEGNNTETTIDNSKKYFFVTAEGSINTTITGIKSSDKKSITKTITTKLDRTAPTVTLTNSYNGKWTNKDVPVTVKITDTGGSGIASRNYWTSSNSTKVNLKSNNQKVTWSKANRNITMYAQATDQAGNKSTTKSTTIKQDITPPSVSKHCFYKKTSDSWQFRYYMKDTGGSGLAKYRWNYCYSVCLGCPSSWMCSYKSAYDRMTESGWTTAASYKNALYRVAPTSGHYISTTARMQVQDNAGNSYTSPNYTDKWYYSGSYSPAKC